MRDAEIQRIRQDLARAKERAAEIRAGKRGVRPESDWRAVTKDGQAAHGTAYERQLEAQEQAVTRFEFELVMAMIPNRWSPAAIIEAMEGPKRDTGASTASDSGARIGGDSQSAQA